MDDFTLPTSDGLSTLQQTLKPYVSQSSLEFQLQDFAQNIETGQFSLPTFSELSQDKKATGPIDANNQRINNLATVDVTSLENILATPNVAANVSTVSNLSSFQIALNTAYCGPLSSTMSVKGKRITNTGTVDAMGNNDLIQFDNDTMTTEVLEKIKQGINIEYALEQTLHTRARDALDTTLEPQTTCYDSREVNIQNGRRAVLPKDYVIKEQTICEQPRQVQYELLEEVKVAGPYDHYALEDSDTIYTCSDPKNPPNNIPLDRFRVVGSVPPSYVDKNKQVANLKYVDNKVAEEVKKRHSKTEDVDLTNTYRVINCPAPSDSGHCVNKSYCDGNSKNPDGSGLLTGLVSGALGGLLGGGAVGLLTNAGSGLSFLGQASGLAGGALSALSTGLKVGSNADFDNYQASNGESQQLINNLKDDVANGGSAVPNQNPEGGGLFNGPFSVSGLFSAVRNAQIGLFDLI